MKSKGIKRMLKRETRRKGKEEERINNGSFFPLFSPHFIYSG